MPASLVMPPIRAGTALVIDDEECIREAVAQILEEIGFHVLAACNGVEGVEIFRTHQRQVKFVLLDSKMPVMDGTETYQQIRRLDPAVPIILSTGYYENKLPRLLPDARLSFLQKPYQIEDFISKVDKVVAARELNRVAV
jgi:two-component system, cell cycle sensor histidine kinase and response regulator CckA